MAFSDSWKIERRLWPHSTCMFFVFFFSIWNTFMLQLAWKQRAKRSPHNSGMQTPWTEFGPISVRLLKLQCQSKICVLLNSREVQALSSRCPSAHGVWGLWGTSDFLVTCPSTALEDIAHARCTLVWTGPASPDLHHSSPGTFPPAFVFFFP